MNIPLSNHQPPGKSHWLKLCLHLLAAILLIFIPILLARGQNADVATTVSSVSSHPLQNRTVVQILANGSLNRAQTFQDHDGFHVIIPDAGVSDRVKLSKGIKVHSVGTSTEILLQTKPGTAVFVQTIDNRLRLSVNGKLNFRQVENEAATTADATAQPASPSDYSLPANYTASANYSSASSGTAENSPAQVSQQTAPEAASVNNGDRSGGVNQRKKTVTVGSDEESMLSSIFSGTSVVVFFGFAVIALIVTRKLRQKKTANVPLYKEPVQETESDQSNSDKSKEAGTSLASDNLMGVPPISSARERKEPARQAAAAPSLYGAYRIDQEVCKLLLGQPHRMDVLLSRASEDRTAIQASLIKTIVTPEFSDDQRRRAREALEEYGFVARESATLLLATDPFQRMSAARTLGEIGSSAAMPFLLEGLYDPESIVRNQAVVSIGQLKVPSAIGALLDMARKHPDVPSSLIRRALSACSVDGPGFFDAAVPTKAVLTPGPNEVGTFDFVQLEPTLSVKPLPDTLDDPGLIVALGKAQSESVETRIEAVKSLAQYSAKNAVAALITIARRDREASVRALAISGLALIDHESVFPAVLIGMADESREVRAASARVLNRLSFDRSEAYVSVRQSSDDELVHDVAQACIKAGIISQNIDRLASSDRRQAYEAFCLISLLAKAKMTEPIIDAIEHHTNMTVRLRAVHLLATTAEDFVFEQLQTLAVKDGMDEELKTALLEEMYKLEQLRATSKGPLEKFVICENREESEQKEGDEETVPGFASMVRTEVD